MKPVEKTIRYLTDAAILAGRVDRRMGLIEVDWPSGGQGFADILVAHPDGTLLIQATSNNGGNHMARVRKLVTECKYVVRTCLERGFKVEVWSWRPGDDEDEPRIQPITLDML